MELDYECSEHSDTKLFVNDIIKEIPNMSKEELEGIKKCIEEDNKVTYVERAQKLMDVIHGDFAIFTYIAASINLKRYETI